MFGTRAHNCMKSPFVQMSCINQAAPQNGKCCSHSDFVQALVNKMLNLIKYFFMARCWNVMKIVLRFSECMNVRHIGKHLQIRISDNIAWGQTVI